MRIVYPKKIAIGVDIGGTKIKAGLVDINGQIIGIPESIRTLAHEPGEMIIEQLTLLIRRMIKSRWSRINRHRHRFYRSIRYQQRHHSRMQ